MRVMDYQFIIWDELQLGGLISLQNFNSYTRKLYKVHMNFSYASNKELPSYKIFS